MIPIVSRPAQRIGRSPHEEILRIKLERTGNLLSQTDLAIERIKAASAAARAMTDPFILCARADGVMNGSYDLNEAIKRLQAFEVAGADLLYVPVPPGKTEQIRTGAVRDRHQRQDREFRSGTHH